MLGARWRYHDCRNPGWVLFVALTDGAAVVVGGTRRRLPAGCGVRLPPGVRFATEPGIGVPLSYVHFTLPQALRYACATMLALGTRCSVGDQLHPHAGLDASTYAIIGAAYREVREKEPWVINAVAVADIGVLSVVSVIPDAGGEHDADTGAVRVL